ncbi:MAG: hypothetical protein MUF54_14320 [Polyangiaceae bacterium]|jgi:Tfp pilus assembly protein PilZ|nr:hypothetical protein [Polyangiaceae bacterium]
MICADADSTIPINPIRQRPGQTEGLTPPPNIDVEFMVPVHAQSEANFWSGLLDSEPAGLFVPTYRKHPLGTLVPVALDLAGNHDLIVLNTVVRWLREPSDSSNVPPGIGLEFLTVGTRAKRAIASFAGRRAPLLFDVG